MENPELLRRLREIGVTVATAHYDGYGDSGAVDDVAATDRNDKKVKLPDDLTEAVREAAETYLERECINWYDNEGGFGDYLLDVEVGMQRLEHNTRISDTEYAEFESNLEVEKDGGKERESGAEPSAAVCTCPTLINGHHAGCRFAAQGGA